MVDTFEKQQLERDFFVAKFTAKLLLDENYSKHNFIFHRDEYVFVHEH